MTARVSPPSPSLHEASPSALFTRTRKAVLSTGEARARYPEEQERSVCKDAFLLNFLNVDFRWPGKLLPCALYGDRGKSPRERKYMDLLYF